MVLVWNRLTLNHVNFSLIMGEVIMGLNAIFLVLGVVAFVRDNM